MIRSRRERTVIPRRVFAALSTAINASVKNWESSLAKILRYAQDEDTLATRLATLDS
jgi:hypothetical protein